MDSVRQREMKSALQDLIETCSQQIYQVLRRPGEVPFDGRCPINDCRLELELFVPLSAFLFTKLTSSKDEQLTGKSSHPRMSTMGDTIELSFRSELLQMSKVVSKYRGLDSPL